MMPAKRKLMICFVLVFSMMQSGCGQTGKLYLPDQTSTQSDHP